MINLQTATMHISSYSPSVIVRRTNDPVGQPAIPGPTPLLKLFQIVRNRSIDLIGNRRSANANADFFAQGLCGR
jgi:hypothetical protein